MFSEFFLTNAWITIPATIALLLGVLALASRFRRKPKDSDSIEYKSREGKWQPAKAIGWDVNGNPTRAINANGTRICLKHRQFRPA